MAPTKTIAVRVPHDVLDRLKSAAAQRGVTVTDLLLTPWRSGDPGKPPNQGSGGVKPAAAPSGVQFGPTKRAAGAMLKKR